VTDSPETSGTDGRRFGGRRFVLLLYLGLVGLSGVVGVLFTTAVDDPAPPALFFVFELPPTAFGFALYGAVTVGVVLGVPLLLVAAVSELADDVDTVGRAGSAGGDGSGPDSESQPEPDSEPESDSEREYGITTADGARKD
jgi:hypothetical protein